MKFDFEEALASIKCGQVVKLVLNGKERKYYLDNGNIICIPNNKKWLGYKVKEMKIDAIMSNEWELVDED